MIVGSISMLQARVLGRTARAFPDGGFIHPYLAVMMTAGVEGLTLTKVLLLASQQGSERPPVFPGILILMASFLAVAVASRSFLESIDQRSVPSRRNRLECVGWIGVWALSLWFWQL